MPNDPSIKAQEGPAGPAGATGPAGPAPAGTGIVTVASGVASATPVGDGLALGGSLAVQAADPSVTVSPAGLTIQAQLDATLAGANAYAQALAYNISSKEPAHAATTAALPAYTVNVAKTVLTATANGVLPPASIDGQTLLVGERLLVKDEAAGLRPNNGIYVLTSAGAPNPGGSPWVLTRTADADTGLELCGAQIPVDTGNTLSGTVWLFSANQNTFVLGTTNVIWTQITVPVATTTVAGTVVLAGDIGGTYSSVSVTGIQGNAVAAGSLTTGQVLRATGASASAFGALDLANASAVTGLLPAANQASQTMAGDVTGTTAASTVAKINGSTVPAGGSLTTGNVLQVTGAGALSYGALNLAGGANYVTGTLPAANQAAQTMAGDVTGTTAASVVAQLQGRAVSNTAPSLNQVLTWNGSAWAPAATAAAGVTAVTAASPLTSTGGTTPQIALANGTTAGNTINWNGSAWQSSALNLAGGAGYVTGVLPLANHAAPATANAFPYMATSGVWNATGLSGTDQLIGFNGTAPAIVSIGSGLSLSAGTVTATNSPGSRVAIDANTLLAWYCNETSGTTFINYGSTASANLTLTGTYTLGDLGLFSHGTTASRFYATATTDGAFTTAYSIPAATVGAAITLEAVVAVSAWTSSAHQIVELSTSTRDGPGATTAIFGLYVVNGQFTAQYYINGNAYSVATTNIAMGPRTHVALVRTSASPPSGLTANTLYVYVNGVQINSLATSLGAAPTAALVRASIGNDTLTSHVAPFKGNIAEVRFSNIARPQSYLAAATKAMGGL